MKVLLTFDCEDFINPLSTYALRRILELLKKYDLKGIFFLTGHMSEKLKSYPRILDLLEKHEIGYHSSAHSVHPTIFEYTDVEDYAEAYRISIERETSRINPLTGKIECAGGLLELRNLFPNKRIVSFRSPGFCWSPPNLDALEKLGIRFDFSTSLSYKPIHYRNITFYPPPVLGTAILFSALFPLGRLSRVEIASFIEKSVAYGPIVTIIHPHNFVNMEDWDINYNIGNPLQLHLARRKSPQETKCILRNFELFLKRISLLARAKVLEVSPLLREGRDKTCFTKEQVLQSYRRSINWPVRYFNYTPQFLFKHFIEYFETD
jgi:peptidoglycan/xylan/chitin deacetylase (PgdA/CDA1 family)